MTTSRKIINRINNQQFFKLCEWLKAQPPATLEGKTYERIAVEAGTALDFAIKAYAIEQAFKALGLRSPRAQRNPLTTDRVYEVAKALGHIFDVLGEKQPEGLRAVIERRVPGKPKADSRN